MEVNEKQETGKNTDNVVAAFNWKYIFLPVNILVLSLVLLFIYWFKLPEETAYTFDGSGLPTRTMETPGLLLWLAGIQLGLTLAAALVTRFIAGVFNRYVEPDSKSIRPGTVISLMGNIIGLPQVIIFFAMIDIFSYNSYGTHLMPLWLNALIFLLAGGIILSVFFLRALLQVRSGYKE